MEGKVWREGGKDVGGLRKREVEMFFLGEIFK